MAVEVPELLTVGRISVDLYGEQLGAGWNDVESFAKAVGGSATNVAIAAARLGSRTGIVTRVGDDPLGSYLATALAEKFGVDTTWVGIDPELPTPLALAVTDPPDEPPLIFYRHPDAPDLQLQPDDVPAQVIRAVPALWFTGTGLSDEPSRSTHLTWLRSRDRGHTIFDLDYRPMLWRDPGEAPAFYQAALRHATVAVGNRAECQVATGTSDPDAAADRLLEAGVQLAVVKQGAEGVLVATAADRTTVKPQHVDVVCGLGAGDGFGGALAHGLLAGWEPDEIVAYANAAGAIVAGRLLCSDAMPTHAEVQGLLNPSEAAS